jgi:hypothetical protein
MPRPLLLALRARNPCCRFRRIFDGWYCRFIHQFSSHPATLSPWKPCVRKHSANGAGENSRELTGVKPVQRKSGRALRPPLSSGAGAFWAKKASRDACPRMGCLPHSEKNRAWCSFILETTLTRIGGESCGTTRSGPERGRSFFGLMPRRTGKPPRSQGKACCLRGGPLHFRCISVPSPLHLRYTSVARPFRAGGDLDSIAASRPGLRQATCLCRGSQIAFAIRPGSGQAKAVDVTQNRDFMTVADPINKDACFDSVTLRRCDGAQESYLRQPAGVVWTGRDGDQEEVTSAP